MRFIYGKIWSRSWVLLSISAMSWAGVTPETYNVYLSSTNHNPQAISFYNPADQDEVVRARVYKLHANTALPTTESVRLTPQRFTIPAHASAAVEVGYQGIPRDTGDEYALEVIPLKARTLEAAKTTPTLSFLTTQKINLHVLPEHIHPTMTIYYQADHAVLQNTGNVSIWVQSLSACDSLTVCHTLPVGSRVRFMPGSWLDLGAVKPAAGFKIEQVWGIGSGKEEKHTMQIPTRI